MHDKDRIVFRFFPCEYIRIFLRLFIHQERLEIRHGQDFESINFRTKILPQNYHLFTCDQNFAVCGRKEAQVSLSRALIRGKQNLHILIQFTIFCVKMGEIIPVALFSEQLYRGLYTSDHSLPCMRLSQNPLLGSLILGLETRITCPLLSQAAGR
jgi:hypothetical protein